MLKKLTSLITLVFMLASLVSIGAYADTTITVVDNYEDFSTINLSGYYTNGVVNEEKATGATNIAGSGHATMYLQNPDFSTNNEDNEGAIGPGTGIAKIVESDGEYQNTLVLEKSVGFYRPGFSIDSRAVFGTTGTNIIEFAIKRDKIAGSDIFVKAQGNTKEDGAFSSNDGIDFVKFTKDGKIYVNGSRRSGSYHTTEIDSTTNSTLDTMYPVGNYEVGVWYEIKIEYVPDSAYYVDGENKNYNGLSIITIDGGEYNNQTIYCSQMHGNPLYRLNFSFENYTAQSEADCHLGYLKISNDTISRTVNDVAEFEDKTIDFEDYTVGNYKSNAYKNHNTTGALKYFKDGFVYNINGNSDESAQIVNLGSPYGNVLKFGKVAANHHQLKYTFDAPYSAYLMKNKVSMEFSLYLTSGVDLRFLISTDAKDTGAITTNDSYILIDLVSGSDFDGTNRLKQDTWLKAVMTIDVPNDGFALTVYDENDMVKFYRFAELTDAQKARLTNVKSIGIYPMPKEDDAYCYLDNIKVQTAPSLAYDKVDNIENDLTTKLDNPVTAFFTSALNSADVTLKCNGQAVSATTIVAGNFVNVIPTNGYFEGESSYSLEINNAKDIFGNTLDKDISFTTGENTTITYKLVNSSYEPIDKLQSGARFQLNLTSNNGQVIPMKAALCVFDNATNELIHVYSWFYITDEKMRTSYDWTSLPVNVTDLDNQHLRLFIWDENNEPMVEEDIIYNK